MVAPVLIAMAVKAVLGAVAGGAERASAKANNSLSHLNADSKNKVRIAQNADEAAKNTLSRWIQSVNNNRALDAGGHALEANTVNALRSQDVEVGQGFMRSIQNAEQAGVQAAAAASSGVDGNVVDMVNQSVALRNSIIEQHAAGISDMKNYDTARRAGSIMSQVVGGLDNSIILDQFDFNKAYAVEKPVLSPFAYALQGAIGALGGGNPLGGAGGDKPVGTPGDTQYSLVSEGGHAAKFGFNAPTSNASPYQLWGGETSLKDTSDNIGSFWSR